MQKKKGKKKYIEEIQSAAQSGAATEVVDRYGSAIKEHHVSYIGEDRELNIQLKRGLKKTSESKINPEFKDQNLKQQAGFSAEDKYTARQNAENIIKRRKERYRRTDDLGRVNDPLFDHVKIDENGVEIIGSGEQMKFVGKTPKDCLAKLKSPKYQKYRDANAILTVPSDYYEGILKEIESDRASLEKQFAFNIKSGKYDVAEVIKKKIDELDKIKKNLKDSGITNTEALEARLNPKLSVAKDITKVAHRAGLEQAKTGALIGGSISLIKNLVGVCKGEITPIEAGKKLAIDTGVGVATAYSTAFAGSVIKGTLQNAKRESLRSISKTNVPGVVVTSTLEIGKSLLRYTKGEITGLECLEELGEKGTSNLSAAMFAVVGQALLPIPVVGGMVGSFIGYTLSSVLYKELVISLKEEKLSYERRLKTEKECEEAISLMERYQKEMDVMILNYFLDYKDCFENSFRIMDIALSKGDIDYFITGVNSIREKLGGKIDFHSFNDFSDFMNDKSSILIL